MRLLPVDDESRYFAEPAGRILRRDRFFCASPDGRLFTLFAWGDLGVGDLEQLLVVLRASLVRPGRVQLVHLAEVQTVSPTAMARFTRLHAECPGYARTVAREAVVRPGGVVGVLAEGFYRAVPLGYSGAVFQRVEPALEWLGQTVEGSWLAAVEGELETQRSAPPLLVRVEEVVVGRRARGLAEVARELGMGARTLQRRLRDAGATFEDVRSRAVVREVERRLLETSDDIKRIAYDLGFRSPSRMSELFVRVTGTRPSDYRAARAGQWSRPNEVEVSGAAR